MAASLFGLIFLTGCDSVKQTFGLDHYQPDEFKVGQNLPLSLPPDSILRPPSKDATFDDAKRQCSSRNKAKNLIGVCDQENPKLRHKEKKPHKNPIVPELNKEVLNKEGDK